MFYFRTRELWNNLPESVVETEKVETFKRRLDAYWKDLPLKFHYDSPPPTRASALELPLEAV